MNMSIDSPTTRSAVAPGRRTPNLRPPRGGYRHGHTRATDRRPGAEQTVPVQQNLAIVGMKTYGVPLMIAVVMAILTVAGVTRVQNRTAILQTGARITDLAAEHARLLDQRRRLQAERAYLRHPDHVQQIAVDDLNMVPATPERIQRIKLEPRAPEDTALERLRDAAKTHASAARSTP